MKPKYTISALYSRPSETPTGESILDAVVEVLRTSSDLLAQDVASRLHVNATYLSHAIELLTGKSLAKMIREWRLLQALYLLRTTDSSLLSIAELCGYANADNLAKIMQKKLRMTPFEYRNGCHRNEIRRFRKVNTL